MAYIVPRINGRFELRESGWTSSGPRSRTLASFTQLTPEVIEQALARSHGVITRSELAAAARRAGVPVERPAADEAAVRLIDALEQGEEINPAIERLLRDKLGERSEHRDRPATDSERSAAAWLGRSLAERGEALRQLLLLADRLPSPGRSEAPEFPPMTTVRP